MDDDKKQFVLEHHEHAESHNSGTASPDHGSQRKPVKTAEDRQAALAAAQAVDPGIKYLSPTGLYFLLLIFCACWSGGDAGMDATVMSAINGMSQFTEFFGLPATGSSGTGLVFGVYTIGGVAAALPASYLPDRFGRRLPILVGNALLIVGAILTTQANAMPMFLGGRFLTGFGGGIASAAAKPYVAEMSSPKNRGWTMGLMNSFYYVGQILASGIAVPAGRMASLNAWRIPLYIQIAPAFLSGAFIYLFPESPRWLHSRGREEEAALVLARLHSRHNDVNSPLIQLELEELNDRIGFDAADKRFWDFRPIFRGPGAWYRVGLNALVSVGGQLSGNGLITYFLTILLRQAGITNQNRILTLNFVNSITSFAGALTGCAVVDRVGRRKLMLFGQISAMIGMAVVAGLLSPAGKQDVMRANAGIVFIYLFMVFFSVGWTPLQALYPTEVLPYETRAKGLALQNLLTQGVSCINTFALPTALGKIGYKTYIIFACFDLLLSVIIYFFVVETKQITLEELDEIFEHPRPVQYSLEVARLAKERRKVEKAQA